MVKVPEVVMRHRLTFEDYLELPDDQDYEIIEGALYVAPRARPHHQIIANRLAVSLTIHVDNHGLGQVVPDADLIVTAQDTYVSPDIMFFRADRFLAVDRKEFIRIIPDLIVEIISPTSADYDRRKKRDTYEKLGVPHYWIAHPDHATLAEHVLQPDGRYTVRTIGPDELFHPALFPGLTINLTRLFS